MASRIAGITIEIGAETTKLTNALKGVDKQIKTTQNALKDIDKLLKLDPKNTELLTQKQKQLSEQIKTTKDRLTTLKDAVKGVKEGTPEYDNLQREIIETEQKLKSLEKEYKDFGSVAKQQTKAAGEEMQKFGSNLTQVGSAVQGVGSDLTKYVTAPIAAVGTASVYTAATFEESMSKVKAISGAEGEDFDKLTQKAREMGSTTKFSASEAADAFTYMAMAGWKTEDMLVGVDGIMALAAASGEDLAMVSDIVTDGLTAFGQGAGEAGRLADIMAAASSNANTNVAMMGETFKYVAPVAGAMGYTMEDVSIATGLMANSGIKASQAGTSLRTLLTNMANPTDKMATAMENLNVSLVDDEGNMKSLYDIMSDLRSGFGELKISEEEFHAEVTKLNEAVQNGEMSIEDVDEAYMGLIERAYGAEGALKAQNASMLAGKNGMAGLMAIVNASDEDFEKLTDAVYGCEGSAKDMADTMQDNLNGELTVMKSMMEEAAISIGEVLMPTIKDIISVIQGWITKFNNLDDKTKKVIVTIALIVAALGPVLLIIGTVIATIGTLITTVGTIMAVTGLAASTIALIPIAIAAVIAIIVVCIMYWDEIKAKMIEVGKAIKDAVVREFNNAKERIMTIVNALKTGLSAIWDAIRNTAANAMDRVKDALTRPFETAKNVIKGIVDTIKGFFNFTVSAPNIPMPHFSISPNGWKVGDLLKGTIPSLGIDWYSKAMNNAMVLSNPSIFGMAGGRLLGGGEAGREVVSGEAHLIGLINQSVNDALGYRLDNMINLLSKNADKPIVLDSGALVGGIAPKMDSKLGNMTSFKKRGVATW